MEMIEELENRKNEIKRKKEIYKKKKGLLVVHQETHDSDIDY